MIDSTKIQTILESKIKDIKLYQQAFTHKSSIENSTESNERLEFIGDSVLSLIVTKYLYEKYPNENEGFLTRIRTKLVSGKALSKIAFQLSFHEFIVMNEKGMKNEWNKNPRLLEDALEAFIGAVYLDVGLEVASIFIHKYIISELDNENLLEDTNYKDILMRYVQGRKIQLPEYKLVGEILNDNNVKLFIIQVFIKDKIAGEGMHKVKKQAEQIAASRTLKCFNIIK